MEIEIYSELVPETYVPVDKQPFSPLLLKQEGGWGERVELPEADVFLYRETPVNADANDGYGFAGVESGKDTFFFRRPTFTRELARPFLDYPGGGARLGGPRTLTGTARTLLVLEYGLELMPRYRIEVAPEEALMVFEGDGLEVGLGGALVFEGEELWVVGPDRVVRIAPRVQDLIAERDNLELSDEAEKLIEEHDPDHLLFTP